MNHRLKFASTALLGLLLAYYAFAQTKDPQTDVPVTYSTIGHGPSLLLLYDSSNADQDWAMAARQLAERFEVTLVDVSDFISDSHAVQRLRQAIATLELDDARIAGSRTGESLAIRYALSYPNQSRSFTLPHTGEDLQILSELINSTPFNKS